MKRVVSVSLGSSKRDHQVELELLGEQISIQRIGTNSDMEQAIELIRSLDGQVDAFGMGGIDLYIYAGTKRYTLRDAERIAQAAKITPIVDGSGLKNTLERKVIKDLYEQGRLDLKGKKVLMVSGLDRFGMAETFVQLGSKVSFGDLIFGLGIPLAINSISVFEKIARVVVPIISRVPFKYLYPTGEQQETQIVKYSKYYQAAQIIAGDFHFIRRYLPPKLEGKIIVTNTVTADDVELLARAGVKTLITTTPELKGRSFGTNVMEGVLVSLTGKGVHELSLKDYDEMLGRLDFQPRVIELDK